MEGNAFKIRAFIISIAVLYAFALSNHTAKREASKYCFQKNDMGLERVYEGTNGEYYVRRADTTYSSYGEITNKVYLSEEYKLCGWSKRRIYAKVSLSKDVVFKTNCIYSIGASGNIEKDGSISIYDISDFTYYTLSDETSLRKDSTEKSREYNDVVLPVLKKSIGKEFTVDVEVEVKCPSDTNETNNVNHKSKLACYNPRDLFSIFFPAQQLL